MVCYEVLTGCLPFSSTTSLNEVKERVLKSNIREILKLPVDCPSKLKNMVEECWEKEPSSRPSFAKICNELEKLRKSSTAGIIEVSDLKSCDSKECPRGLKNIPQD